MKFNLTIFAAILTVMIAAPVLSQDQATAPAETENPLSPLGDRGGLPIPENLFDIKNLSLTFWIKFRGTSQYVYRFVNEAAQFQSYTHVCKRHELNISLSPITELANRYIQAAIPAHYDEPEFAILEPLTKNEQQAFLEDMSSDLYAFEYGFRIAQLNRLIADSGSTKKVYCESVEKDYKDSYIALRATAIRRLSEFDKPAIKN